MFRNYFKVAVRNLLKQKSYSFINIFGLTIGIASCLLIPPWVLIASLIAWPIVWFLMSRWLEVFANRITIGPGTFLMSGVLGLLIAGVTVSTQTIKTALANPVGALKVK